MSLSLRQILVLCLCACGLQTLAGQFNHAIAPFALTIDLGGLLIALAGLRLAFGPALAVAFITGLWVDASAPVAFGQHAFLYGLAVCLVYKLRDRLPREETFVGVVAAMFINLGFCVVAGFLNLDSLPDPASGTLRLLADLVASQLVTALISPWFFALQLQSLRLAGASPATIVRRYA
jgi:cell shape-determining protein MreD